MRLLNNTALVDISTIMVKQDLPKSEKIVEYVRQVKDPFRYISGRFTITAKFPDNAPSIEECLQGMMS
jgi:predicted small secreted protein